MLVIDDEGPLLILDSDWWGVEKLASRLLHPQPFQ